MNCTHPDQFLVGKLAYVDDAGRTFVYCGNCNAKVHVHILGYCIDAYGSGMLIEKCPAPPFDARDLSRAGMAFDNFTPEESFWRRN